MPPDPSREHQQTSPPSVATVAGMAFFPDRANHLDRQRCPGIPPEASCKARISETPRIPATRFVCRPVSQPSRSVPLRLQQVQQTTPDRDHPPRSHDDTARRRQPIVCVDRKSIGIAVTLAPLPKCATITAGHTARSRARSIARQPVKSVLCAHGVPDSSGNGSRAAASGIVRETPCQNTRTAAPRKELLRLPNQFQRRRHMQRREVRSRCKGPRRGVIV